jgi:ribonuclease D
MPQGILNAPNLCNLLTDSSLLKIFHFARFDVAILYHYLGVMTAPIYCTKIASKLTRTYTERHGLKDLCKELLGVELSKQEQTSDWGTETLTETQLAYAASDVLYLHRLKEKLESLLARENKMEIAQSCFDFMKTRTKLDLLSGSEFDIFHH